MERPVIPPLTILPTAPETLSVLEQRMRVAEEQADALISDLQALDVTGHRFTKFQVLKSVDHIRPISPVRARPAFTGDGDTLWKNCEDLVTRMCHMESMLHTLKLNIFRLHTDRELSTKRSGELEHCLLQMQEEHAQDVKEAQLEVMRLRQRLNCAVEEQKRERQDRERLSAALEIATTTKTDVAIAAEELKATKACMSQRLAKLQDKLAQEAAVRAMLEEEHAVLLLTVQDMRNTVEEERTQVQELQHFCQQINRDGKGMKDKLENAESRCQEAEKDKQQIRSEMEAKDSHISQLQEEIKIMKQKCEEKQAELLQVRADSLALREAAEKVQCLNQHLENQCSELTETVQKLTNHNMQLVTQHQHEAKVAQDSVAKRLQEQEALLRVVQTKLGEEVQKTLSERTQLERELESLRAKLTVSKEKAAHTQQKSTVQIEMQEITIGCLRADLDSALQNKAALENEKALLQEELAKRQVEVLSKLTDSKNKLAYEKGKLQSTVEQLQSDLQSFGSVHSENSKLRKLNATLQSRYTQVNSEFDSIKIQLQRLEAKLQQTEQALLCKEEEFALVVQARDQAIQEEKRLRQQFDTLEEMQVQTKTVLQQELSDICEEKTRMSQRLENVLFSHTKLQEHLEILQTELGRKDNDLLCLHKERHRSRKHIEKLKAELLECNTRLNATDCQQRGKIESLQKFIDIAQEDNRKLAHALDLALQRNSVLQNHVHELEKELQKELQEKTKSEEDCRVKEKLCEEKLVSLKKQNQVESKEAKKAARKEITELKKALDSVTEKSTELSQTNRDLRSRGSALEKETSHQKDLIRSLKTQLQSYIESKGFRKQNERIQDLEAKLAHMKNMKDFSEKSNNEQCKRIQEFMNEIDDLRKEINAVMSQDVKESTLRRLLEEEVASRQKLEQKCKELECKVLKLQKVQLGTEIRLRDANEEPEQEFSNLKMSSSFPLSTLEHWETKQKLQLISRNLLLNHKTT
ncbi:coiled-coil domain-containing protein 150 [Eleutherodactylus coqui]|uniref:coiled-coil domain-containing protein 150 n=1 Tax=Eleutherodactylus coqui TaxID=57060 RepID=UPI003462BA49